MRRLLLGGVLSLVFAAPASADQVVNGTAALAFEPAAVTVAVGETVTWQFPDTSQAHNVNSDGSDVNDPDWEGSAWLDSAQSVLARVDFSSGWPPVRSIRASPRGCRPPVWMRRSS